MEERWLPVEGGYEVSDMGRVRSWRSRWGLRKRPLYIGKGRNRDGYHMVKVGGVPRRLHHVVLEAFVGPCPMGQEGCHDNGDRQDNRLTNLRWDTRAENMLDKVRHGRQFRGEAAPLAKLTENGVREARKLHAQGASYADLGKQYGVAWPVIRRAILRITWRHVT